MNKRNSSQREVFFFFRKKTHHNSQLIYLQIHMYQHLKCAIILKIRNCGMKRGVVDKSLTLYPGVPSLSPGSPSLSDVT